MRRYSGEKVEMLGLGDIDQALRDLVKPLTARNVVVKGLRVALEPMRDEMIQLAPEDQGDLKRGIGITRKLSRRQRRMAKRGVRSDVEVYLGPDVSYAQNASSKAVVQEFGSVDQPPQPYIRPAWERHKREVAPRFAEAVKPEITRAAQRLERKAARELKKMEGRG